MKSEKVLTERIKRGVRYLDKNHPNWISSIELDKLDLADPKTCVIGEVVGDFFDEFDMDGSRKEKSAIEKGFCLDGDDPSDKEWSFLTFLWRKVIAELKYKRQLN